MIKAELERIRTEKFSDYYKIVGIFGLGVDAPKTMLVFKSDKRIYNAILSFSFSSYTEIPEEIDNLNDLIGNYEALIITRNDFNYVAKIRKIENNEEKEVKFL